MLAFYKDFKIRFNHSPCFKTPTTDEDSSIHTTLLLHTTATQRSQHTDSVYSVTETKFTTFTTRKGPTDT